MGVAPQPLVPRAALRPTSSPAALQATGLTHALSSPPQVAPAPQKVVLAAADGTVISEGRQHVICLQLEGRWMPLENVSGGWWFFPKLGAIEGCVN